MRLFVISWKSFSYVFLHTQTIKYAVFKKTLNLLSIDRKTWIIMQDILVLFRIILFKISKLYPGKENIDTEATAWVLVVYY